MASKISTMTPGVSFIIATLNSSRTLSQCLTLISRQNYPHSEIEIILLDGGSTDATAQIAKSFSNLDIKFISAGYPTNMEARRFIGFTKATHDLICILDSDNYLASRYTLSRLVEPLVKDPSVVSSFTLHYHYVPSLGIIGRYIGLFGNHDPVAYYLGKADRQKITTEIWPHTSQIVSRNSHWTTLVFNPGNFPTLGSNGSIIRKSLIPLSNFAAEDFFHTDILFDLLIRGYNKYAVVDVPIIHDSSPSVATHVKKRLAYMLLHSRNLSSRRRYKIFDPHSFTDLLLMAKFIIFTLTLIEPLVESLQGYSKKKDPVWFIHPVLCWLFLIIYSYAVVWQFISAHGHPNS